MLKVPYFKTHFENEITNFSRTQGSTVSRPEDDETHASTLSKSDVVLSFQLEVIDDEGVEKIELVLDDPKQPTFLQVVVLEVRNLKSVGDSEIIYCTMEVDSSGSSKCTAYSLAPPTFFSKMGGARLYHSRIYVLKSMCGYANSQPRHMGGRTYRLGPASKK